MSQKFEGVKVRLGAEEYVVPALSLRQVRELNDDIVSIDSVDGRALSASKIQSIVKVVHAAVSRNYPEITLEQIEEQIDLSNCAGVIKAVFGVSGLETDPAKKEPAAVPLTGA